MDIYEVAVKQMQQSYRRKFNTVLERYTFYLRLQREGESMDQYVAALRPLAVMCDFEHIR